MNTFILLYVLAGAPAAQLGTYDSLPACQAAIKTIFMANIAISARNQPAVISAVDTTIKYQQEYSCVSTRAKK